MHNSLPHSYDHFSMLFNSLLLYFTCKCVNNTMIRTFPFEPRATEGAVVCSLTRIIRTYLPSASRLISQICSSPYPSFSFLQKRIRSGKCWCRGRSKRRCIWQRGRRCCRTPPFPFLPSNSNMVSLLARMNTLVRAQATTASGVFQIRVCNTVGFSLSSL